ncbi:hypothetical protein [Desulfurispora thermophila]|uniref:hypothetical protein n=1 Tax=Desulfurispora thermophila TaxID=265470 RepID=UPI000380ED4B|nr:hypothetical protein [Desulfurispora thermophila]
MRLWTSIQVALLAAMLVWLINTRLGPRFACRSRITLLGPAVEEAAKTLLALSLGAWLPGVHLGFGLIEGVWEWLSGRGGRRAALVAVLTHGALGGLTWYVLGRTGSVWPAVCAAWLVHAAWNALVLRLARPAD